MLGLPPPEGGGILSDAMALRAAMRRRKPEKLRSVVARSRSASLLPPQTERSLALAASERTLPERSLALSQPPSSERRLAPARSRPPPSERGLRPSERAPKTADALLSRSWTAAMPKLSELALESRAPTPSSARFLPRASSGGDDASLVAGLVGSTRDAFLEAPAVKRRVAALLSKPEAVGDRPPPALPAAPGPPPTAGLKVAGVRRFGTAALGASGAFCEIREDALVVLEHDVGPARPRGKVPRLDLRLVQGADIGRVMPLLRPANRERFAALAEPVRDRNKVWRLASFRFEWRKKPRRLKLGRYPPKRVATALFNGARDRTNYEGFVGCAAATEVLERRCYILSRSYCHVTLLGVGFAGRIYVPTHAINAINRCLKLRCYVAECAQYCETTLGTRDVEALFGHRADYWDLLKPGNRGAFLAALREQTYLRYALVECWWTSKKPPRGCCDPSTGVDLEGRALSDGDKARALNACEASSPFLAGRRVTRYEDLDRWHTSPEVMAKGGAPPVLRGEHRVKQKMAQNDDGSYSFEDYDRLDMVACCAETNHWFGGSPPNLRIL